MSPAILRGVMGSCLALGIADLAWLDANAERVSGSDPDARTARIEPLAPATRIERLSPLALPSPISPNGDEVPGPLPTKETQKELLSPAGSADSTLDSTAAGRADRCVVHFESAVSVISDDQLKMLIPIADAVKSDPRAVVRVEGHADRTAWTGKGSNLALSDDRASAIVRALVKMGVPPDRIRRAAFGDTRPLDERSTEEAYRLNRRAEIRIERMGDR